jgi:hypothetical protein
MIGGDEIVTEARSWINTRYRHQGRLKGVAVDCVGLIIGVGINLDILDCTAESVRPWDGYARTPNPARMGEGLASHLVKIESPITGDIAWLGWRENLPMHLAILGSLDGRETLIHASGQIGKCAEHDFSQEWCARVMGWWRYPRRG